MASEVYVSTDIEADGPIPGPHSMLSLGSVAFSEDGAELGAFTRNLETLPEATGDAKTMAWWRTQPKAWESCRRDLVPPDAAMRDYAGWLERLPGRAVFVAYPAGFDFTFVYWYLIRFHGQSPFSHSALDVKTFAMAALKSRFHHSTKRHMPRRWFSAQKHSHVALEDAREQGLLFLAMKKELFAVRDQPGTG